MYLICSVRTNVVFVMVFLTLDIALFLLTGAYWKAAQGDLVSYEHLAVVSHSYSFRSSRRERDRVLT